MPLGKANTTLIISRKIYGVDIAQNYDKGMWPGSAPLAISIITALAILILTQKEQIMLRKGFELYATGKYTLKQIARAFKDMGLRSYKGNVLAVSCVQRILSKSFYYGLFEFKGETYQGTHEPIITKKLFDTCQEVMKISRTYQNTQGRENFSISRTIYLWRMWLCHYRRNTKRT